MMKRALLVLAVGLIGFPAEAQAGPPMTYGYFTDQHGRWAWDGDITPEALTARLIRSNATYIKIGKQSPPVSSMRPYFDQLLASGKRLGVRLNVRPPRTREHLLTRARQLAESGYYQWIFLDGATRRPRVGRLIRALQRPEGGHWAKVATNDTGWRPGERVVRGEWAHTRHLSGLGGTHRAVLRRARRHDLIGREDIRFIHAVRRQDRGSLPVLKFEVHTQTDMLRSFSTRVQRRILRQLTTAARRHHFTLIYPMFVNGLRNQPKSACQPICGSYNSAREHTYRTQRRLLGTL